MLLASHSILPENHRIDLAFANLFRLETSPSALRKKFGKSDIGNHVNVWRAHQNFRKNTSERGISY